MCVFLFCFVFTCFFFLNYSLYNPGQLEHVSQWLETNEEVFARRIQPLIWNLPAKALLPHPAEVFKGLIITIN